MKKLNEEHITPYWRQLFTKICPQSSIDEWEGVNFVQIAKAAMNGDKSAREYIFWQMKDIIETKFSKDRKRISIWANHLSISEKNSNYSANDVVDNWVSASWMAIFDGYPITDTNTIGPFIKYIKPGRELDYLTWVYFTKVGAILYMSNNLEATGGMSTELTRKIGNTKQDLTTSSGNEKVGMGDHSINREIQDDITSTLASPEEEFELRDNLKTFRAFTKDPELNEKKHGFSPMIAFKTIIANMAKGENAEKNVANLAAKYKVSRNTFAAYAQRAADDLVEVYNLTLKDLQGLLKRYGPEALSRLIKESSYNPKPLAKINENYDFRLLESLFMDRALLNESNSIYDAHAEYEKDVEQKKEEDDNQENFTFDEGSVKLTTVVKESNERKYWNKFFDKLTESVDSDRIETLLKDYFDTNDVSLSDETCWGLPVYIVDSKRYAVGDSEEAYDAAVQQAIGVFEDDTDEGKIRWLQGNNWPGIDEESVCDDLGDYEEGEPIYRPSSISDYLDTMGFTDAADAFSMAFIGNYLDKRELGEYVVDSDGVGPLASEDGKEISIGDGLSAFCLGGAY